MTNEELVIRIKKGETELVESLWLQSERLVKMIANNFYNHWQGRCLLVGVDKEDLYQQGFLALLSAVDIYDDAKGLKFNTHLHFRLKAYFSELIGIHKYNWQKMPDSLKSDTILFADDGTELSLLDSLPCPNSETEFEDVETKIYNIQLRTDLDDAIETLEEEEKKVVNQYHFNNINERHAISEIAQSMKLAPAVVYSIYKKALDRLSRIKALQAYKADIISRYGFSVGVRSFRETGLSSTELTVLMLERHGLLGECEIEY